MRDAKEPVNPLASSPTKGLISVISGRRRSVQSLRGFLVSFPLVPVLGLALSCGGSQPSTLFAGPDAAMEAGPQDSASQPDVHAVDAPNDVLTPIADSAGPTGDAAPLDGSDVDGQPPGYSVACGTTTTCEAPGQFCCLSGLPGNPTYACDGDSTSCGGLGDAKVYCTSTTQCPGSQVCCGHVLPPAVVTCQPTCTAANDYVFCDPTVPSDCPPGHKCVASTRIVGYNRCN
jgi:hypothetical protein